jgi:2',3'-cyclic-nucleotide 2'-phosphodiesterase (5'-nucleotidase family)
MRITKKYNTSFLRFVLFLTIAGFAACSTSKLHTSSIQGQKIPVDQNYAPAENIEAFIKPYRDYINKDLDSVLAYCPETMDKSKTINKWQTTIGSFMADITFEKSDKIFFSRYQKHIDVCLLNHGGIRAIIPKGNITTRTAYEIMPFENAVVVIALKGERLKEIANYIVQEKKPHPLSGMRIVLDKNDMVKTITVNGIPVQDSTIYYVATSDYLANGGDKMDFFRKGIATYTLDYKIRNLFIDYFKEVDTLPIIANQRIITE